MAIAGCMVPEIWCTTDGWQTDGQKKWHIEVGASPKNLRFLYNHFWAYVMKSCHSADQLHVFSCCFNKDMPTCNLRNNFSLEWFKILVDYRAFFVYHIRYLPQVLLSQWQGQRQRPYNVWIALHKKDSWVLTGNCIYIARCYIQHWKDPWVIDWALRPNLVARLSVTFRSKKYQNAVIKIRLVRLPPQQLLKVGSEGTK